jgi:hypothetical protein
MKARRDRADLSDNSWMAWVEDADLVMAVCPPGISAAHSAAIPGAASQSRGLLIIK